MNRPHQLMRSLTTKKDATTPQSNKNQTNENLSKIACFLVFFFQRNRQPRTEETLLKKDKAELPN